MLESVSILAYAKISNLCDIERRNINLKLAQTLTQHYCNQIDWNWFKV